MQVLSHASLQPSCAHVASRPAQAAGSLVVRRPLLRTTRHAAATRQHNLVAKVAAAAAVEIDTEDAVDVEPLERTPSTPQGLVKSFYPKGADCANELKKWYVVDAEGQTLGRLACLVANYIRGKNSVLYTPSMDIGAYVVVLNAEKVTVTGRKVTEKKYRRVVNGRPGSMKTESFKQLQARIPERIIEQAVKGMLPKGRLGNTLFRHLKVYKGTAHPHSAQQPEDITGRINQGHSATAGQ